VQLCKAAIFAACRAEEELGVCGAVGGGGVEAEADEDEDDDIMGDEPSVTGCGRSIETMVWSV